MEDLERGYWWPLWDSQSDNCADVKIEVVLSQGDNSKVIEGHYRNGAVYFEMPELDIREKIDVRFIIPGGDDQDKG